VTAGLAMVTALAASGGQLAPALAQSPGSKTYVMPQWQTDAGGKMEFDVASVKPNKSDDQPASSFPLGPGDAFIPTGGLFRAANFPMIAYLRFAYKLGQSDLLGLPNWVNTDRFDIEARARGNPTKDQMRLMMQSLLADRFRVVVHTEARQGPVYALLLLKPGKTGPQFQVHPDDGQCTSSSTPSSPGAAPSASSSARSSTSGLHLPPISCGAIGPFPTGASGRGRLVGRNVTTARIAGFLTNPYTGVDRPVLDRTGLRGAFDFSIEWSLPPNPDAPSITSDGTETTFLDALQEQLGLKLRPQTGSVDVIVVDHVEPPSEN
jgi:uncharacterized protein (TIGR03435 family)